MLNIRISFLIAIGFLSANIAFASDAGYFGVGSSSQYLNISKMNDEFQITSLMNSAISNDLKAAKIFIASGDNVNQRNIGGATALHLAARNGSYEVAEILIANNADINSQDNEGWTPLMRSCLKGDAKMIATFLNNGASAWLKNKNNESCLVLTAMADCFECAKLVLDKKHDGGNYIIDEQVRMSLPIVSKRYNEPFIKLLNENKKDSLGSLTITEVEKKRPATTENIVESVGSTKTSLKELVYIFTGASINEKELDKIQNASHNTLVKAEKKEKKSNVAITEVPPVVPQSTEAKSTPAITLPAPEVTTETKTYKFKGQEKAVEAPKKEEVKKITPAPQAAVVASTPLVVEAPLPEVAETKVYSFGGSQKSAMELEKERIEVNTKPSNTGTILENTRKAKVSDEVPSVETVTVSEPVTYKFTGATKMKETVVSDGKKEVSTVKTEVVSDVPPKVYILNSSTPVISEEIVVEGKSEYILNPSDKKEAIEKKGKNVKVVKKPEFEEGGADDVEVLETGVKKNKKKK